MAEKGFSITIGSGATESIKVGLSGICKRVRMSLITSYAVAAGAYSHSFAIGPVEDEYASIKDKFVYRLDKYIDAAPATAAYIDLTKSFDTNFYIDKEDWLIFRNVTGGTNTLLIWLDIVPVSDRTKLMLGGEYHN